MKTHGLKADFRQMNCPQLATVDAGGKVHALSDQELIEHLSKARVFRANPSGKGVSLQGDGPAIEAQPGTPPPDSLGRTLRL